MTSGLRKSRKLRNVILNAEHPLGQSEELSFCEWLAIRTCNIWCNVCFRIYQSIRPHFKCSVNM